MFQPSLESGWFSHDIALNIELSLLNESLKIPPEYDFFFFGTVLQIVICSGNQD